MPSTFDDLLEANRAYAAENPILGFDGVAHAGVAIVTCMDSRIAPLQMIGLKPGDAKIFRNPGGRGTDQALEAMVLATDMQEEKRARGGIKIGLAVDKAGSGGEEDDPFEDFAETHGEGGNFEG